MGGDDPVPWSATSVRVRKSTMYDAQGHHKVASPTSSDRRKPLTCASDLERLACALSATR